MSTRSRRSTNCSLRPPTCRAAQRVRLRDHRPRSPRRGRSGGRTVSDSAEPHDPATWLPVPDPDTLLTIPELANGHVPPPTPRTRRRTGRSFPSVSSLLLILLVVATVAAAVRIVGGDDTNGTDGPVPAFAVTVDLDGVVRTVHTTEQGAAEGLMRSLKVDKLVGVRNMPGRLREGSDVVLRTRHNGILVVDGQKVPFDSASATVDELLVSNNVVLVGEDYTSPSHDSEARRR